MRECLRSPDPDPESCTYEWGGYTGAAHVAEAALAVVPERAGMTFTARGIRQRLPRVRWAASAWPTSAAASGTLQGENANEDVVISANLDRVVFAHPGDENVPDFFDLVGAFRLHGAQVAVVGCVRNGDQMPLEAFAVTAPGRLPFLYVSIYIDGAPPYIGTTIDITGAAPTLARAREVIRDQTWTTAGCRPG